MHLKSIHWLCAGTAALTFHFALAIIVRDNIVGQGSPAAGPPTSMQGSLAGTLGSAAETAETEILEMIKETSLRDVTTERTAKPLVAREAVAEVKEAVPEAKVAISAASAAVTDVSDLAEVKIATPDKMLEVTAAPPPEVSPRRELKNVEVREVTEQKLKKEKRKAEKANGKSKRSAKASVRGNSDRKGHAGVSGGAGGKAGASGNAISAYASQVRARILSRRPGSAGRGTAVVSFGLSTSGSLQFARIARSSGDSGLDQKALASVRGASPFPAPPGGATASQLRFSIPFQFR